MRQPDRSQEPARLSRLPWRYVLSGEPIIVRRRLPSSSRTASALAASWASRLVVVLARSRWRWTVLGQLPATGAVLVSTHTNYWDGILASMLDARIWPVAGSDWKSTRGAGWWLRTYGVVWADADPVATASALVARGDIVWIAPAGWEKAGRQSLRRGAAAIAHRGQVPVHLLRIESTGRHGLRRPSLRLRLEDLHLDGKEQEEEEIRAGVRRGLYPAG